MKRLRVILAVCLTLLFVGAPVLAQEPLQAEGELNNQTPTEEFDLDLRAGQTVTITTEVIAGNLDTVLVLYDPSGRLASENDDRGDGTYNSQITYTAQTSGTFTIEVRRYDESTRGRYQILVEFGDAAAPETVSSSESETLEGEGRLDDVVQSESYELELAASQTVTITTLATSGDLDTMLVLFAPDGDEVASNDDRGDGTLNSQIVYEVTEGGIYVIEVTRYDSSSEGDYTITVEFAGGTTPVSSEAVLTDSGTIDDRNETESWDVNLESGTIVVITAEEMAGNLDPTLELYDPSGDLVASNDDRGDGTLNSEIVFTVVQSGIHTIVVSRYDGSTEGDYAIAVNLDPNATPDFSFVDVDGEIIAQFDGQISGDETSQKYDIELTAGLTVYASAQATSGDLDTILSLVNPNGRVVAVNDDRGDGTYNSAIAYTVEESGTYTLLVERYEGSATTGAFVLIVQSVDEEVVQQIGGSSNEVISLSGPVEILETENFRIHYTLAGSDATTEEYAREFARTLQDMYDVQINQMGWAAPPTGADGWYDAYLADVIGSTEFSALGYARPLSMIGDNPNTAAVETNAMDSVLVVDNDYYIEDADVSPQTLMRATTSHEFNHMIQFGYDADETLFWLFEATAVWIETVTVGDDQDATGYIEQNHQYPELCFATGEQDGSLAYGDWTFMESLADRYGESIVRRLWENAVEYSGLEVIEATLSEVNETFANAVVTWRVQNLAMDYDLGELFPRTVWLENTIENQGTWTFTGAGIQEFGANYFEVDLKSAMTVELDGTDDLELWFIGVDGDTLEAFQLGDEGVVDPTAYRNSYLMVFHRITPSDLDDCSYLDYGIRVDEAAQAPAGSPTLTFSAVNFRPLR